MTDNFEKSSVFGKNVRPAAKFQQNDALRKAIYFEIRKLNTTLPINRRDSRHTRTIEKFIDAMIPSKAGDDDGKLPVYASKSVSPVPDRALCVYYLVSCLVQSYWAYLKEESSENLTKVEHGLKVLEHVNQHYNEMEIEGNVRSGYVLKVKK